MVLLMGIGESFIPIGRIRGGVGSPKEEIEGVVDFKVEEAMDLAIGMHGGRMNNRMSKHLLGIVGGDPIPLSRMKKLRWKLLSTTLHRLWWEVKMLLRKVIMGNQVLLLSNKLVPLSVIDVLGWGILPIKVLVL